MSIKIYKGIEFSLISWQETIDPSRSVVPLLPSCGAWLQIWCRSALPPLQKASVLYGNEVLVAAECVVQTPLGAVDDDGVTDRRLARAQPRDALHAVGLIQRVVDLLSKHKTRSTE